MTYHVAADTPEHGLELIRKHEELVERNDPVNLSIDTTKDLGPAADEALGVLWRSGRVYLRGGRLTGVAGAGRFTPS